MNVSFCVTSSSVIVQRFESGTISAIEACMWSSGLTVIEIVIDGAGVRLREFDVPSFRHAHLELYRELAQRDAVAPRTFSVVAGPGE